MKNNQRGLATPALIIIVALAILTGGIYTYSKLQQKGILADDLISSARSSLERSSRSIDEIAAELTTKRGNLEIEVNKLDRFNGSSFDLSSTYGQALSAIRAQISDSIISKTEKIFQLLLVADIDPATKISLTQDREELIQLVDSWQQALISKENTSQGNMGQIASSVVIATQDYLNTLVTVTESIPPTESNLTPGEIQDLETASDTVQQISEDIDDLQPDPEDVQDLAEEIQDLEQELETAIITTPTDSNETATTSDESYIPPPYIAPPIPDTSGKPQLIQGENQF